TGYGEPETSAEKKGYCYSDFSFSPALITTSPALSIFLLVSSLTPCHVSLQPLAKREKDNMVAITNMREIFLIAGSPA
ncbi:hypothetical protein, partial [uncultured Sneathiella sp.]|uniref:hypothetical protein n=1 Tax=uncultured Sneathiella sp. TaxID=879315 RepID=UPI0030D6F995